jgi:hypothetical protein
MRNKFPGYYRPTPDDCSKKFKECIFSFDTNVLLNLYRFTPESRQNLLTLLEAVKDRVWLPHQVGLEYHENRVEVIISQRELYEGLKKEIDDAIKAIQKDRRSGSFYVTTVIEPILKTLQQVRADLDKQKDDHPDLLADDPILEVLTNLFDGKVGDPYKEKEQQERCGLAKKRFEAKTPPGFRDSSRSKKKDGDRQYGDVILWFQLLDHAKTITQPLVLITDETGDDWWLKDQGRTTGPRPELLQEMYLEAKGKWFYMYSTDKFLEYSKQLLNLEVKPQAIQEAKDIKKQDEERAESIKTLAEIVSRPIFPNLSDVIKGLDLSGISQRNHSLAEALRQQSEKWEGIRDAFRASVIRPEMGALEAVREAFRKSLLDRPNLSGILGSTLRDETEALRIATEALRLSEERRRLAQQDREAVERLEEPKPEQDKSSPE